MLMTELESGSMTGHFSALKEEDPGDSISLNLCLHLQCHQCGNSNDQYKWCCCEGN